MEKLMNRVHSFLLLLGLLVVACENSAYVAGEDANANPTTIDDPDTSVVGQKTDANPTVVDPDTSVVGQETNADSSVDDYDANGLGQESDADSSIDDPASDLTVEPADINPGVGVEILSLITEEQQATIASFEEARHKFENMSLEEFRTEYGPNREYRDDISSNPLEATNLELIRSYIDLSQSQLEAYETQGFTILKDVHYTTFFQGFVRIYSDDLPLYFSVDAMLDALHLSFDRVLMDLEIFVLSDALQEMLDKMENSLEERDGLNASPEIIKSLDDAAVWLCVARSLLAGEKKSCLRDADGDTKTYLKLIEQEAPVDTSIFGKGVKEDFSQFKPRGHYTKRESLKKYFRSMMWIQRIGLDFSKYSRHALMAYLLTDLLYDSGAIDAYETINRTIEVLVGVSDSMNAIELKSVAEKSGIVSLEALSDRTTLEAFVEAALVSGVANQQINSTIMAADQTLPEGEFTPIPPIFNFMGQRFIVDSYVFTNVVYDRVKDPVKRYMPSPLDTWFVLGNRETVPLLQEELDIYQYQANLATLDYLLTTYQQEFWQNNFYNAWLSALMTLDGDTTSDSYPPVMRTRTWQKRMLNAQLASWSHLRHDTLLYAKPSYTMTECEYPDAWVDPYPEFFERIASVAELAVSSFDALGISTLRASIPVEDPLDTWETQEWFSGSDVREYYIRLGEVALLLKDIAQLEIEQEPLTEAQLTFMNQLIFQSGDSGAPPFDGWYRDLIYKHSEENSDIFDPTIADIHTDPKYSRVLHVGTGYPNAMLISIKTDCQLRAYLGPVLSYYEVIEDNFNRLNDESWKSRLESSEQARPSWTAPFIR